MKFLRKKEPSWWRPVYDVLAQYNSEVARGLVHTDGWAKKMAQYQEEYNSVILEVYDAGRGVDK